MNPEVWLFIIKLFRALAFVLLYFFLSFGPGFIIGILLANATFGKGKTSIWESHVQNKKIAAQHNSQWDPSNPRWR